MRATILSVRVPMILLLAMALQASDAFGGEAPLEAVQGKWKREQPTPAGKVTIVKEHVGNSTTVTGYDPRGNIYYEHASQFSLDTTGKVDTLTFFNPKILAGAGKGKLIKEPVTFIYRVKDNKFYEVYGLLADDKQPLRLTVWERVPQEQSDPADKSAP